MDHKYIEYHQIVESFILGADADSAGSGIGGLNEHGGACSREPCDECQRDLKMREAFINVLREELRIP